MNILDLSSAYSKRIRMCNNKFERCKYTYTKLRRYEN